MAPFHPQMALTSYSVAASGGNNNAPALPTLTSTGQTPIFRLYANAPTAHLYKDNALTLQANPGPVGSEDTVLGIKDISPALNNFVDTQVGAGSLLRSATLNGKNALIMNGTTSLLESDNSANINLVRTATNIAMLAVFEIVGIVGQPYLMMGSVKSRSAPTDCFTIRISSNALMMGRWGGNSIANSPLRVFASTLNAGWSDYSNKTIKMVLRAAKGVGAVQKLDLVVSDGTTSQAGSTTYTNNGTDDVDATSTAWDYITLGGWYLSGTGFTGNSGFFAETAMWMGTSQMNDADVASLLTYAAGTAGF